MRTRLNKPFLHNTIFSAGSTITSPTAYWKLDESSGNRVDSCSSPCNLTSHGTVSSVPGKINNAASVSSGNSYLSDDTGVSKMGITGTFSVSGWFNLNNSTGGYLLSDRNASQGFKLGVTSTGITITTYQSGPSSSTYTFTTAISSLIWYFFAAYYDSSTFGLSINGGTFNTSAGVAPASLLGNNGDWTLLNDIGRTSSTILNGSLDETAFWASYKLTQSEVTALYNSGSGKTFNGTSWV